MGFLNVMSNRQKKDKKPKRRRTMVDRIKHIADKELLDEAGRNVNVRTALILKHHVIEVKPLDEMPRVQYCAR